jgi:hypothetical protein
VLVSSVNMYHLFQSLLRWFKSLFKKIQIYIFPHRLKIYSIERITPGKRHAWLNTNVGLIRKPLGSFTIKE